MLHTRRQDEQEGEKIPDFTQRGNVQLVSLLLRHCRQRERRRAEKTEQARQSVHCHITYNLCFYVASLRRCVRRKKLRPLNEHAAL